jgi:hypothetical protein
MSPEAAHAGVLRPAQDRKAVVLVLLAVCALAWPMYWNGFPLVFSDTGTYVASAIEGWVPWDRPIFYSLFLRAAGKGVSLYAAVLIQALMAAYVVVSFCRAFSERAGAFAPLLPLAILAVATPLPWLVSWLMPDYLGALAVLIPFMLLFLHDRLGRGTRFVLGIVFYVALVMHTGTFLVSVLELPLLLLIGWVAGRGCSRRGLMEALSVLLVGYVSLAGANAIAFQRWTVNVGSEAFLTNRLIGAGLMQPYLDKACTTEPDLLLCPYRDEIEKFAFADEFLWGRGQLARRVGATHKKAAEAGALALRAILDAPWRTAAVMAGDAARLSLMGATPCRAGPHHALCFIPHAEKEYVQISLKRHHPQVFESFLGSRQQRSELGYAAFIPVHDAVFWLFLLATLGVLGAGLRTGDRLVAVLAAYVVCILILNAAVHTLSGPVPRYQAKVGWLVALAAVAGMQRLPRCGLPRLFGARQERCT